MVNPAYMTRQVHELARKQYGVKGHITSLHLIRPRNKPDAWEKEALQLFETGKTEASAVTVMEGEEHLRFIRPVSVEEGCLKCHGYQKYQRGDIRYSVNREKEQQWRCTFRS